jgi:UDP-N-acetylglucosamine--N-acetylmuramyl-(pentapeptide) pyrophosphoryl-undecaprenol N-acetylglucosamine transferase
MRILFAAGGTGGHVYPALAVAEAMTANYPDVSLCFVGSVDGFERPLVQESGVEFTYYDEVRAGPLHGVNPIRALVSAVQLVVGTVQSLVIVARRRPQALLLTGGWVGLPVALAAWVMRVPAMIYLPDIEPGLTIQVLRRFAQQVAVTVVESAAYFHSKRVVVTGYPVRQHVANATREAAVAHFGLDPQRKTLLVFGGSRGARSINNALMAVLPDLLADGIQVIHITGTLDWPQIEARRNSLVDGAHYHAFPYLHDEMGLALAAADLVVSRAGASVLGEFPLFGLASILVPYPHAWRYQKVNADYLANRGAAVRMDDERMSQDLLPALRSLLDDNERLSQMRTKSAALAQPDAAQRLAMELARLAGGSQ